MFCSSLCSPTDVEPHNPPPPSGPASSLALVPLSDQCGTHNPPPFEAKRPRWQSFPLQSMSFPSPINLRSHNPLSSGPSVFADTRSPVYDVVSLSNQCGLSQSTPFWSPVFSLALVPLSHRCRILQ